MADDDNIFTGSAFSLWNLKFILTMHAVNSLAPVLYYSTVFITTEDTQGFNHSTNSNETLPYLSKFETITEEFELVDEIAWISDLYHLIGAIGTILGSVFTGLSDKFGRLNMLRIFSYLFFLAYLMIGLSPNLVSIFIGRLLTGICFPIMDSAAYALVNETIPLKYRTWVGLSLSISFSIGSVMLGVSAYFIRSWRVLHLVLGIPVYILPCLISLQDESPRWLIQHNRCDEAFSILMKLDINKNNSEQSLNTQILSVKKCDTKNDIEDKTYTLKSCILSSVCQAKMCMHNLFGSRMMSKLSIALPLTWFFMSISNSGIPLNAKNFTSNHYLYMVIVGIVRLPSAFISPLIVHRYGNITSLLASFILLGLSMLWTISLSSSFWWLKWVLVGLGVNFAVTTLTLSKFITVELIPTSFRTTFLGICNVFKYIGIFTVSFIHSISSSELWWLFYVCCTISCTMAAFIVSFLPETHGKKLEEN